MRNRKKKRTTGLVVALAVVGAALVTTLPAPSAGALTGEECEELIAEGKQAREDLASLIANNPGGGTTQTTTEAIGSYVAQLLESAQINEFGFVSADAGAPLEVCLPAGTTKLTMFSTPVVLWEGAATTGVQPVTVTIPADTECGTHTLEATGPGVLESVEFEVGGSCSDAGSSGDLPRTGAAIGGALAVALGLLAIGYAALRGERTSGNS